MRRSRTLVVVVALSALVGGVSTGTAKAGTTGTADIATDVFAPNTQVPDDAASDYQVNVYNYGDDAGGGTAANGVQVSIVVAGATLVSVNDNPADSAPHPTCTVVDSHDGTCTFSHAVAVNDQHFIDAIVTGGTSGTTESVTSTVSETPASADPDPTNNSYEADVDVVDPPVTTFANASATPDPDEDAVILQATLKADGAPVSGEEVDVSAKPKGAPDSAYVQLDASGYTGDEGAQGVVHIEVGEYVSVDGDDLAAQLAGPVTFRLMHSPDSGADTASTTIDVPPRHVTTTVQVPSSLAYSPNATATLHGSAILDHNPDVVLIGTFQLESRPAGSSAAWSVVDTPDNGDDANADFDDSPKHNTDYRTVYISDSAGSGSSVSTVQTLPVKQRVDAVASPVALPPGGTGSLTVAVSPTGDGGRVTLEKMVGSKWHPVDHDTLSGSNTRSWTYPAKHLGSTSYRVVAASTSVNAGNTSAVQTVKVEKHGGGSAKQHAFLYNDGSEYARWNPCKPIHYQVNTKEAPKGALADVKEALRRISQITKLRFAYDGKTKFIPSQGLTQKKSAVIAWAHQSQTNVEISNGIIGEGGGSFEDDGNGKPVVTHGYVVLLAGYKLNPGFGAGTTEGDLLMHELGHMIGLDHVNQTSQIMYPQILPHAASIYGAGDYKGLHLLGRSQGCLKTPSHLRATDDLAVGSRPTVFEASAP